jgi:Domain of unknown function (DUF3372)
MASEQAVWTPQMQMPALQPLVGWIVDMHCMCQQGGNVQVAFHNTGPDQTPGVLGMTLSSSGKLSGNGSARDEAFELLAVWINARADDVEMTYPETAASLVVHPAMAGLPHIDEVRWDDQTRVVMMPARTMIVLGQPWPIA